MQRLIISDKYSEVFVYKYLPRIFNQIATNRILSHKKSRMNSYLNHYYDINLIDVIKYLKLVKIDRYKNNYIMHFDIEDRRIREIFHIISYGNLDVQGLRIIDGTFDYIAANINSIYSMFRLQEELLLRLVTNNRKGIK